MTGKHTALVRFQACAVVYLGPLLFWDVTWCRLLVPYEHFGVTCQFCVNTQVVRYGILESLACYVDVQRSLVVTVKNLFIIQCTLLLP
jgi:hypothetical protein